MEKEIIEFKPKKGWRFRTSDQCVANVLDGYLLLEHPALGETSQSVIETAVGVVTCARALTELSVDFRLYLPWYLKFHPSVRCFRGRWIPYISDLVWNKCIICIGPARFIYGRSETWRHAIGLYGTQKEMILIDPALETPEVKEWGLTAFDIRDTVLKNLERLVIFSL